MKLDNVFYKRHRDDECYVDELRIITRERYKTSSLSGDEWRFHRVLQCFRKGVLLFEKAFNGTVADVASYAPWQMVEALENGEIAAVDDKALCFQPGCSNKATSEYEIIEEFGRQGERLHPDEQSFSHRRKFCQKHLRRGDCGREDQDANYRVLSGYGPDHQDFDGANIVESARHDIVVGSVADLPGAIDALRDKLNP